MPAAGAAVRDHTLTSLMTHELDELVQANWNNVPVLVRVVVELGFRKRRRARMLAQQVSERVRDLIASHQESRQRPRQSTLDLYPWQERALSAWDRNDRWGIVEAVTGAGKTMLGLAAIEREVAEGGKATVLVPSVMLLNQRKKRLADYLPHLDVELLGGGHSGGHDLCDVLIATVQSGARYRISPKAGTSLLVADEVHRYGSEFYRDALEDDFDSRLGLSATWERADGLHEEILEPYFDGVVYTLDYRGAIHDGVISGFRFAMIGVSLPDDVKGEYEEARQAATRLRRRLIIDHGAPDEPFGAFMKWVQAAKHGQVPGAQRRAGFYLSAFQKQQKILAEASGKIECAAALAPAIREADGTLAFTNTVHSARSLAQMLCGQGIAARAVHSDMDANLRRQLINAFELGAISVLVAPKILDEGIDLPDADLAIIVANSASRIQLIQRMGRVLRRKDGQRLARIALLYVEDTPEDPNEGAHGVALADISEAAGALRDFRYPAQVEDVVNYLRLA